MTDYDKLTVVKLREELVKRGLPKYGLKAVLIQRLVEADTQPERPDQSAKQEKREARSERELKATDGDSWPSQAQDQLDGVTTDDAANPAIEEPQESKPINTDALSSNNVVEGGQPAKSHEALTSTNNPEDAAISDPGEQQRLLNEQDPAKDTSSHHEAPPDPPAQEGVNEPKQADTMTSNTSASDAEAAIAPISTQTSLLGDEELKEDTNKRKRRSQSPPPSTIETARKRAKADVDRLHVKLPEDESSRTSSGGQQAQKPEDSNMLNAPLDVPVEIAIKETESNGVAHSHMDVEASDAAIGASDRSESTKDPITFENQRTEEEKPSLSTTRQATPPAVNTVGSPLKQSPSDARFKNLFTGPLKRDGSPVRPRASVGGEDRVISPALHPVSSALYIRDLLRPINPMALKDHLSTTASPPGSSPNPNIITTFFLDNVRTHCLVGFANTSAAARVRLGLHDRVWPDEKNRKPLWVDFVPEEKLQKWVDVETEAASDRKQGLKKWEVVYEEEDGGVMAFLQEAGPNSTAQRSVHPTQLRNGTTTSAPGFPSGSRAEDEIPSTSRSQPKSRSDGGKGFQALDELFRATAAKPKLYYLPAAQSVVDRRLDMLAAGRGGGRSDEKRRYTFEEGSLVDKGPEFGFRRGVYGARGGGYGGYRGGGYRGDNWRGRR